MLTALLTSLLTATPATGLTLSVQVGRDATPPTAYLDALEQDFLAVGQPVRRLDTSCEGERACLIAAAHAERLPSVVAVTLAAGKKQTTIDLEAVRVRDGATIGQLTFVVVGRLGDAEHTAVKDFATRLIDTLGEAPLDRPVVVAPIPLTPEKPVDPLALTTPAPAPAPRTKVPAILLGGGALASAATSGVFLGLATDARAQLEGLPAQPDITRRDATDLAASANRDYSVALATGIAAGALATGALIWLLAD